MTDATEGTSATGGSTGLFGSGLRDVVLIAVGVWLAFAVDGWAERRGDHERQLYYLRGLQVEFAQAKAELEGNAAFQSRGLERLEWLLHRVQGSSATIPQDSIRTAFWDGYRTSYFTADLAVYSDLVRSGSLDLIESDSLRVLFGNWEGASDFHRMMKDKEHDGYATTTATLALEHVPLHMMAPEEFRGIRLAGPEFPLDPVVRHEQVMRSVQLRMLDSVDLRGALRRLQRLSSAITQEVESELQRLGHAT